MAQDPLIEKNRALMEDIWSQIPKEKNLPPPFKGEYIRYIQTDPKYLYQVGFVDEKAYTMEEWEAAFEAFKQEDGTYLISKEQFISLGKYKYTGPIKKPLDAMKIREGWYELEDWRLFAIRSVFPSTILSFETWVRAEKVMRENKLVVNGRIKVDKAVKLRVKDILDNYPSPARRRELAVEAMHQKRLQEEAARSVSPVVSTTFERGAKLGTKEKKVLSETLLKSSQITPKAAKEIPTLSVKDLRKKSKPKKQTL